MAASVVCAEPLGTNQLPAAPSSIKTNTTPTVVSPVSKKKEKSEEEFDRGVECLQKGDFAAAAAAFQGVIAVNTNNAEAFCNLAIAYVQLGYQSRDARQQSERWQRAADSFGKAAEIKPKSKLVYLLWADALTLIGDTTTDKKRRAISYQEAMEKCRKATKIAPLDWEAYNKWAMLLATKMPEFAVNDRVRFALYKEGAELFGKAMQQARFSGELAPAYANWGSALMQAAQFTQDPSEKEALLRAAKEKFEKSAKAVGTGARIWFLWGQTCLDLGRLTRSPAEFREAVDRLNTSLSIDDKNASTLYSLACAYSSLNREIMALETLKKCFELDEGKIYLLSAQKEPDFASLREQERFNSLLDTYLKQGRPGL